MSKYKNLWLGISAIALVLIGSAAWGQKASAAPINRDAWNNAQYTLLNENTIEVVVDGQTLRFTFTETLSNTVRIYKPSSPPANTFCSNDTYIRIPVSNFNTDALEMTGGIYANYRSPQSATGGCLIFGTPTTPVEISITNRQAQFTGNITFQGNLYVPIGSVPSKYYGKASPANPPNPRTTNPANCYNGSVLVLDSAGARTGTAYAVSPTTSGLDRKLSTVVPGFPGGDNCYVTDLGQPISLDASGSATVANPPPDNTGPRDCAASFDSGFEWVICPLLKIADAAAGAFNGFISDQLCFRTNPDNRPSTTDGVTCEGANNLNPDVQTAWGIIKNIASALLVITMLAMVFSQATNLGGIDAYAVRKMLPKLVIAVILIQLSWVLLKWVIDLSNDAGKGISDLLLAPFGGEQGTRLDHILDGHAVTTDPKEDFFFFAALAIGGVVALANLPGLLLLAFYVVLALFVAFLVLTLRKIFIILLVILAPIALIAWVLPGTERYWKMWQTNFTKLLVMFPLIMAMIAGGRIFAWITAGRGGGANGATEFMPELATMHLGPLEIPHLALLTEFATLAIVVFAYFAPYFLLPKAFSWGGGLMGAAVNAVNNNRAMRNLHDKGGESVKGWGERQRGRLVEKYNPDKRQQGLAKRTFLRVASGHYIPKSSRSRNLAIQMGEKWSAEETELGYNYAERVYKKALSQGYKNQKGEIITEPVRAGKEALGDLSRHKNSRVAEGAIKKLLDTQSWPEIQSLTHTIDGKEKKIFEDNKNWDRTLAKSPEHYSRVLRSRVDAASHVIEGAKKTYDKVDDDFLDAMGLSGDEKRKLKASGKQLSFEHQRVHRMWYSIAKQMSNEDLATQSEGFWQDAAEFSEQMPGGEAIQSALRDRLSAIQHTGSAGQQILGHLSGGTIQPKVERALGKARIPDIELTEYLGQHGRNAGLTPVLPPSRAPRGGGTQVVQPAQAVQQATQQPAQQAAQQPPGPQQQPYTPNQAGGYTYRPTTGTSTPAGQPREPGEGEIDIEH